MAAIRKNSNTGMILGVCAGVSEWSGIPVHLIRVVTAVACVASVGIVAGGYVFIAGVLTDTAECSFLPNKLARKTFTQRLKSLYQDKWWRADYIA